MAMNHDQRIEKLEADVILAAAKITALETRAADLETTVTDLNVRVTMLENPA